MSSEKILSSNSVGFDDCIAAAQQNKVSISAEDTYSSRAPLNLQVVPSAKKE